MPLLRAILLSVVGLFVSGQWPAFACVCGRPADPPCHLTGNDVAFVGKVTDVFEGPSGRFPDDPGSRRFVFKVEESFGAVLGPTVEVESGRSSCGVDFAPGGTYLVDGQRSDDGTVSTSACSFTQPARFATTEIEILRRMAAGKPSRAIFGVLVEFRKPGPKSRPTDPDLWQPLTNVHIAIAGGPRSYRTRTDNEGRFVIWNPLPGTYHLKPALPPPLKLWEHSRSFHYADADPEHIELAECSAQLNLVAQGGDW